MNDLICGTDFETKLIQWKIQRRIYNFDPEMPLVGRKWFSLFMKRNPELVGKAGKKYPRNRAEHCHDSAFNKMCNQNEHLLVKSGNAVWLDSPVHMDIDGNIVEDEALAFGRPVNISITRPENVFVMDETGDNTHGKSDSIKGGEKKVVPAGEVPREEVGIEDSHFTVAPFHDLTGQLRFLVLIFKGTKLKPSIALGVDVFAEWDDRGGIHNFGTGKRHPGLQLSTCNGKAIPILFTASSNALMNSEILTSAFK